ncbi:nucleotidyl transferase AbiEii/AbiGii toxin family protein [Thermoflexus sp.]|uniref:nucleotidyl transferase AbiEii/AbiGii toxin family protein n=1 Tax=Thermoflexus sp. TaxID=1969742 RepID=UPI00260CFA7B|nr:nucleotidyl transferase AbiEii/AbiGii toxin family protein [Thermoflexus sp.]MCX7691608.1 nucleotidyl transferase AbiEii/AbiGii toxin family protein [Thermoflexus sp.]MDW8183824.1 nucleotidyl transferase AbiEii/AbiGii toxin family protein [Anaerolineae bacterium]
MLRGKGLLQPLQKRFLTFWSSLPDHDRFYLSGGTALAEFYLGHRISFDLDFFTAEEPLILPTSRRIEATAPIQGWEVSVIRRFVSFVELTLAERGETLRVELALDAPYRLAPVVLSEYGVWVNDWLDLAVDKLLAYYGRAEPRDAVDLYFIFQQEPVERLLKLAARKDPGFDLYWFAVALNRAADFPDRANAWPVKMLLPFDPVELKRSFQELALDLMARITRSAKER